MGCHFLLQRNLLDPGIEPKSPHCRRILYRLSHQGSPTSLTFHHQFSQEGYDTGGRKISGSELIRASGLFTCPSRGKDGAGQLVEHAVARGARTGHLALCVPEARGPQGLRQEPGAVSARARDLWPHLRLRHPPPVQVRNCAAGVGPGSSPFLEGLCEVRLRCAGREASSRVCVAWTAPVTSSSSSGSGAPFMRARARRGLLVGQARRRDHHGRTRRRPPAPVVQCCAAASCRSLSASGDSLIKPSGGAGP